MWSFFSTGGRTRRMAGATSFRNSLGNIESLRQTCGAWEIAHVQPQDMTTGPSQGI